MQKNRLFSHLINEPAGILDLSGAPQHEHTSLNNFLQLADYIETRRRLHEKSKDGEFVAFPCA